MSDGEAAPSARVDVLTPRDVPLGGPRAMSVRRTLPQRDRTLIGAWCFADHYGPDDVTHSGGMEVPPHPHTHFGVVEGYPGDRRPAPALPNATILPCRNPPLSAKGTR